MRHHLVSLLLGVPLTLGVLLFMAALVEPGHQPSSPQARRILISMQEPVLEAEVRTRPQPPTPPPDTEPMAIMSQLPALTPEPIPLLSPPLDLGGVSPIKLVMPDVAPSHQASPGGQFHGQVADIPKGGASGEGDLLVPLQRSEPVYPYRAQQAGIEGEVTLTFVVDSDGQVQDVSVVSAKPRGQFERAAIRALRQWRYQARPTVSGAIPQVVTLKFRLENYK